MNIRRARPADRPALAQMLARCSAETRLRRFHGFRDSFPEPYLAEALAGSAGHFAVVAQARDALVGLASCCTVAADTGEIAVLVEDDCQRRGIGAGLLHALVEHADRSGLATLKATVLADQTWVIRALGGYGTCAGQVSAGVWDLTLQRDGSTTWTTRNSGNGSRR